MILTAEELEQLTDEQAANYIQGIVDFLDGVPFDMNWNEIRKEGFRDVKEVHAKLVSRAVAKYYGLDKYEASSKETINATNE